MATSTTIGLIAAAQKTALANALTAVRLAPGQSYVSTTSGQSIVGSSATESVVIGAAVRNVSIDSKVEKVSIAARFESTKLASSSGMISFTDSAGAKIVDLAIAAGHGETVSFTNGSGTLSLDALGKGVFKLASIVLSPSQVFTATTSGISISGSASSDATTVILTAGVSNESIGASIGQVKFAGKSSDYLYLNKSGTLYVYDQSGHNIAAIQIQNDANGTNLIFADGNHYNTTLNNGGIKIGTVTIPSSAPADLAHAAAAAAVTQITPSTMPASNTSSFHFSLTMGSFGQYQSAIQADMTAALNNIGKFLNSKGVFTVQVLPETVSAGIIADASGALVGTPTSLLSAEHGANLSTTFQMTSLTGIDPNPGGFDATVHINMTNISRMNLNPNIAPTANQIDMTTALTHEIMHAIGFEGFIGTSASGSYKTAFDTYVTFQNGKPYFTGPNAEAVYGGQVPLAPASAGQGSAYYHLDVANDLMSTSLGLGQTRTVSALDLAILRDLGVPEIVTVGSLPATLHA